MNKIASTIKSRSLLFCLIILTTVYFGTVSDAATDAVCIRPMDGLVSWYRAEGNGDDTQGAHHATLQNGTAFTTGVSGLALALDGADDYVDLGNWFNLQTFSIEMWVRAGTTQMAFADIIDNNHTNFRSWVIQYDNTGSQFHYGAAGDNSTITFNLTPGQWQHLVVTRDADRATRLYLDNVLIGSTTAAGDIVYDGSQFLRLSAWGGGGRHFNGSLDEVTVYDRALSVAEVDALYRCNRPCTSISLSPESLGGGVTGASYSQMLTASGGVAPYSFELESGALPPGLSLNSETGIITGTPTVSGAFNFSVSATDTFGCVGIADYRINVSCAAISLGALGNGTVGTAYTGSLQASGGAGPYTYSISGGTLPPGLSLDTATGDVSGTPTTAGNFNFQITATDANGCTGTRSFSVTVVCRTISLTQSLPGGVTGNAYSNSVSASGGTGPYTYSVTSGALPAGLTLNVNTGELSGNLIAAGSYNFTITATDSSGCSGSQAYTVVVSCPIINLASSPLPTGIVGTDYLGGFTYATSGSPPFTYAITSGFLPTGLHINSDGYILGVPLRVGQYAFTVTATDSNGCMGSRSYSIEVVVSNPSCVPPSFSTLAWYRGEGNAIDTRMTHPGTLRNGTSFSPGRVGQAFSFDGVDDQVDLGSWFNRSEFTVEFWVNAAPGQVSHADIVDNNHTDHRSWVIQYDDVGTQYHYAAADGRGGSTFNLTPGTWQHIAVSRGLFETRVYLDGLLLGAFPGEGPIVYDGTQFLRLANWGQGGRHFKGSIDEATFYSAALTEVEILNIYNAGALGKCAPPCSPVPFLPELPVATGSTPYHLPSVLENPGLPIEFSVSDGALPPGLTLHPREGSISGTPTAAGIFNFTVRASSVDGCVSTQAYALQVNPPVISVGPLPATAVVGSSYYNAPLVSGGAGPHTLSITNGALPPGLSVFAGRAIEGIPTVASSYSFELTATDVNGFTGSSRFTIIVSCPNLSLIPNTLLDGIVYTQYTQNIGVGGLTGPYTFIMTGGFVPGLFLNFNSGLLSGTPLAAGRYHFTVSALHTVSGCSAQKGYTIEIAPPTPAAPDQLRARALSSTMILLRWNDVASNELIYFVERCVRPRCIYSQIAALGVDSDVFVDTGLSPGTQYQYRVRASNIFGYSDYSNSASVKTDSGR